MREPPKRSDETIIAALRAHYGISIAELTFLPIGNDSASSVYRARAADETLYFVKLRTGAGFSLPSLAIPRYLYEQGVPHIVAPLPTLTQSLWVGVNDFALTLYPFIDGRRGVDVGLTAEQWHAFGAMMKQVHTIPLTPEPIKIVPRETFTPWRRNLITELEAITSRQTLYEPWERELAAFWHSRRDEIRTLVDRADMLARELRQTPTPLVLCHADMHINNVLLDTAHQWWLVDWDETMLALKERDLMFVVGGISRDLVSPHETSYFLEGYGDATIDPRALTYYRYAWAVQDIAADGERVFFLPDLTEKSRREAVHAFMDLFEPGQIVAIALASDNPAL